MPEKTRGGLCAVIAYLPVDLYDWIAKQAKDLDRPFSYVVRELLAEARAQRQPAPPPANDPH